MNELWLANAHLASAHLAVCLPACPSFCCFDCRADDVQVVAMRQVARRTLSANVTAMLGVDVPPGATGGPQRGCRHGS